MEDLSEHPQEVLRRAEFGEDVYERAWREWTCQVEDLLGIQSLDGDERADGYSLDFAYDAFRAGTTAEQYADSVRTRQRAMEV